MGRRRKRGGMLDFVNLLILNSIFNSPSPKRGRRRNVPVQPANEEDSILVQALGFIFVVMAFVGGIKAAFITLISLIVICAFFLIVKSFAKTSIGEQDTQVFTPTDELAALLNRQSTADKIKYLGCNDIVDLGKKYSMCVTAEEWQLINQIGPQTSNNVYNCDDESSYNPPQNDYKPVTYDEDDTYDNFYMQREDEYRQEYGDDYEDAIEDAWGEHQRNKKKR